MITTDIKDSICYMCTSSCPVKVHVRNGKAVKIEIPDSRSDHCPRWKAMLDFVYHPDRLTHPLKRTGERGSITMKANVTDTILESVVSLPHHWPDEANVNITVDDVNMDPVSGFIPYKSQLCQVTRA